VAVGNGGLKCDQLQDKKYLGEVAQAIMHARRMNVIFVP